MQALTFTMEPSYYILARTDSKARIFQTVPEVEFKFLDLIERTQSLSDALANYSTFAGIAAVLFVFRILKVLDFQARMGIITRTVSVAFVDLYHFLFLFMVVFFCYASVGIMLFGHQF